MPAALIDRFNGAAGARPRNLSTPRSKVTRQPTLQWGRGRAPAESVPERLAMADCRGTWLQWGRGRAPAESWTATASATRPGRLQWGRGRAPAESPNSLHGRERSFLGFNGAAGARPRNLLANPALWDNLSKLQWGRGRAPAESFIVLLLSLPGNAASMGPRARARGIAGPPAHGRARDHASMGPRARARGIRAEH